MTFVRLSRILMARPAFVPNPDEVAEVFSFALEDLLRPRFKFVEQRRIRGVDVRVPYYEAGGTQGLGRDRHAA